MIWIIIKKNVVMFVIFTMAVTFFSGLVDKVERRMNGIEQGVHLEDLDLSGYYAKEVREAIKNLAIEKNKDARNAHIDRATGEIVPGVLGIKVNVEETVKRVLKAQKNTKVKLVFEKYPPKYGKDDIKDLTKELGSYVTGVGGTEERYNNVQLATKSINYFILFPGDIFSFNKTVGPRTEDRGYRPAPIMNEGGTFLGPGGGVCQVSSTLYNAVLNSRLKVVERHKHARPVGYVPPDRDATVDFAWLDFKFQNNTDNPIIIRGVAENRSLRFWINGPNVQKEQGEDQKQPQEKQF